MAARAGTAYVKFEGDFGRINRQVAANTAGATKRFENVSRAAARSADQTARLGRSGREAHHGLRLIGRGAAYALGAGGFGGGMYALFDVTRKSVSAFRESQRVGRQTNAVLRSTGRAAGVTAKQVNTLANALAAKTGIDDEAIQASENLLLTFTRVRNEAGRGNDIFNRATKVTLDLATAMNHGATPGVDQLHGASIQLGKALNDPITGMTALRRVGVSFDAQQQKTIKGLEKSGHHLDAQRLILRELNKEFGGSAVATATAGDKLKVTLGNVAEAAGRVLAPALSKAASSLNQFLAGALAGTGAGGRFGGMLSVGFGQAKRAIEGFVQAVRISGRDVSVMGQAAQNVFRALSAVVAHTLPGITQMVRGWAELLGGAIKIVSGLLTLNFREAWRGVRQIFRGSMDTVVGVVRASTGPMRAAVGAVSRPIVEVFAGAFNALKRAARSAAKVFGDVVAGILRGFAALFSSASHLPIVGRRFRGLADAARHAANRVDNLGESMDHVRRKGNIHAKITLDMALGQLPGVPGTPHLHGDGTGLEDAVRSSAQGALKAGKVKIPFFGGGAGGDVSHPPGAVDRFNPLAHLFGLHVTSGFRPGAITDSGHLSYHALNRARDYADGAPAMLGFARYMADRFGGRLKELIHTPLGFSIKNGQRVAPYSQAGHYNHVHVAYAEGGTFGPSQRLTRPVVSAAEEAPRYPEFFISTNPRDRPRSVRLLAAASREIIGFARGGILTAAAADRAAGFHGGSLLHILGIQGRESSWNAGARGGPNTNGTFDWGLSQINDIWSRDPDIRRIGWSRRLNAYANALMARVVLRKQGWGAWAGNRSWTGFLPQARRAVAALGHAGGRLPGHVNSRRQRAQAERLNRRLQQIKSFGLSSRMESTLKGLGSNIALYAEMADRAQQITGDGPARSVGGLFESEWVAKQLSALFQLRNRLVEAHEQLVAKRGRIAKLLARYRGELHSHRRRPSRARASALRRVINALKGSDHRLGERDLTLLGQDGGLQQIQGLGSPMRRFASLPALGVFGGDILAAQLRAQELAQKVTVTDTTTTSDDSGRADILVDALRKANVGKAVAEAEVATFSDPRLRYPFAGSFGGGGVVRGPVGAPVTAILHGGERVHTADGSDSQNVLIVVEDGAVDLSKIRAVANGEAVKVTRQMSRSGARRVGAGRV